MINIKRAAIATTGTMTVRDAAGEIETSEDGITPLSITFHSPGIKTFQKAKHASETRNNDRVMARMQGKGDEKQTADEKSAETAEFMAAVTVSFNGFGYDEKTGFDMFKAAFADPEIGHITEDANKFLGSRANFLKKSQPA